MHRRILGLVAVAAMAVSFSAHAQLISSVVTDSNGLMWANTVGINLGWSQSPGFPDTAQAWVAGLNAGNYGGYDDWMLATGDGSVAPNTTTNQLGELFYTDCGNSVGSFTSLTNPGKSCSGLSSLQNAITADDFNKTGMPLNLIISATPYHPLDDFEQQGFWAYQMDDSSQRVTTTDTVVDGVVGRGDALAVRRVNQVPEIESASAASWFTLLLGCMAVLRGRRKIEVCRK